MRVLPKGKEERRNTFATYYRIKERIAISQENKEIGTSSGAI